MDPAELSRLTRGQFIKVAGATAAGLLTAGASAPGALAGPGLDSFGLASDASSYRVLSFRSRPDLSPPWITVNQPSHPAATREGGYWFLAPGQIAAPQSGPIMVGDHGRLAWFKPMRRGWFSMNFRTQRYRGKPVLTWWEGTFLDRGEGVIVDSSYREIARIRAANGHIVDPHELLLTPEGTALITCSPSILTADLSSVGGAKNGTLLASVMQEIDVQSGRLIMEWRSLDHLSISESYMRPGGDYDFMHLNSIDIAPDGNLLISGRHTWALYKLERRTGQVMWRLGGKRSDFDMGRGAQFTWQHDARQLDRQTITLFDDGAAMFPPPQPWLKTRSQSRGLALRVDEARRTVRVTRSYHHHPAVLAYGFGNLQTLPDGDVVIAWGEHTVFSRYTHHGGLIQEAHLPRGYESYRGYHNDWKGLPRDRPALTASRDRARQRTRLYASWNGATGVHAWRVSIGRRPGKLHPAGRSVHHGFETSIDVGATSGYASVTALDHTGRALHASRPVKL